MATPGISGAAKLEPADKPRPKALWLHRGGTGRRPLALAVDAASSWNSVAGGASPGSRRHRAAQALVRLWRGSGDDPCRARPGRARVGGALVRPHAALGRGLSPKVRGRWR